jgi:hypothetical protein
MKCQTLIHMRIYDCNVIFPLRIFISMATLQYGLHYAIKQPELKYKQQLSKALQTHMEALRLAVGITQNCN